MTEAFQGERENLVTSVPLEQMDHVVRKENQVNLDVTDLTAHKELTEPLDHLDGMVKRVTWVRQDRLVVRDYQEIPAHPEGKAHLVLQVLRVTSG